MTYITTEVLERPDVTVQEHLLRLVQIRPGVAPPRRREPHHEHRHIHRHPSQHHTRGPEIDLGLPAQPVILRDHHLDQRHLLAPADLGHIAAHRRLAHLRPVFLHEPLPHPPGRVALLAGRRPVRLEPAVDRRLPPIQRRRRPHPHLLAWRRHRRQQRLAHITPMHAESAGQLPDRHLFALMGLADLLVHLNLRPRGHRPPSTADTTHPGTPTRWGQIR